MERWSEIQGTPVVVQPFFEKNRPAWSIVFARMISNGWLNRMSL